MSQSKCLRHSVISFFFTASSKKNTAYQIYSERKKGWKLQSISSDIASFTPHNAFWWLHNCVDILLHEVRDKQRLKLSFLLKFLASSEGAEEPYFTLSPVKFIVQYWNANWSVVLLKSYAKDEICILFRMWACHHWLNGEFSGLRPSKDLKLYEVVAWQGYSHCNKVRFQAVTYAWH